MSDITEPPRASSRGGNAFGGKLGPLPVWAWGVLVAAVILFYVYSRKGKTTGLVTGPSVTAASPSNVSNIPLQNTGGGGTQGGVADTNTSWLQQGIRQGSDLGFTPLDTETALRNYLNGSPLTQAQANIVNAIEKAQGSAPQGIGGTPSVISDTTPATSDPYSSIAGNEASKYEGQYVRNATTGGVLLVKNGTLLPVSYQDFKTINPQVVNLPGSDPIFGLQRGNL